MFESPAARKTAERLGAEGGKIVWLAATAAETVEPDSAAEKVIRNVTAYDWLVFTDGHAVDHFFELAVGFGLDSSVLDALYVCSVGEWTARKLARRFIHSDVITRTSDPKAVFEAVNDYSGGLEGNRLLVVEGESGNGRTNEFGFENALVEWLAVYRLRLTGEIDLPKVRALLLGGALDAIVITSPQDILSLTAIAGKPLEQALKGIELLALDGDAYQAAFEQGQQVHMLPRRSTALSERSEPFA